MTFDIQPYAVLGRYPLSKVVLCIPYRGGWYADMEVMLEEDDISDTQQTLYLNGDGFVGTVRQGFKNGSVYTCRFFAGPGTLDFELRDLPHYKDATIEMVVSEIARLSGFTVDLSKSDATVLASVIQHFLPLRWLTVEQYLDMLCDEFFSLWFIDYAGSLVIGDRTEQTLPDALEIKRDGRLGYYEVSVQDYSFEPGVLYEDNRIWRLQHTVDAKNAHTRLFL